MAEGRPTSAARPRWSQMLRALREARGVTQEGWAALLRVGVNTVGRWESGTAVPNALAEQELIAVCRERGLFRVYAEGPLGGLTLTPALLSDLLAEARLHPGQVPAGALPGPTPNRSVMTPPTPISAAVPRLPHLPIPPTPLVGRDDDLARLLDRLRDPACRLVTVTGVGGVGKTRLSLQAASDLQAHAAERAEGSGQRAADHETPPPFAHGVAFVPLTAVVGQPPLDDLLATAIATALGFSLSGQGTPAVELTHFLREKAMLLVLDDVEHLQAAGPFLTTLLHEAPALKILTTSRSRLNVRGEWIVELAGLTFPTSAELAAASDLDRFSAIDLFVRTAHALAPDFLLNDQTAPAVQRICELVGGLPLGIELAASWVRLLSCAEIAAEIERSGDFLAADLQDLPERHRSLRAVFTTSWDRLGSDQQQTLQQLAIFLGSFAREAATVVADATLPRLAALVDRSLVRALAPGRPGITAGAARYELLTPVRQYASEHLRSAGQDATTRERHASYYLGLLERCLPDLRGPRQREALALIEAEIAQVRLAWQWAVECADPAAITRASDSLFHFYDIRSWFREGADAFLAAARALEAGPDGAEAQESRRAWGKVLARHGWFTFHLGRQHDAKTLLGQSVAALRSVEAPAELVFPLNYLGAVESYLGNPAQTDRLCREAMSLADAVGDPYGRAIACNILGQTAYQRGEYPAARSWSEQSLAIEQQLGNRWSMAYSLTTLGRVAYAMSEYAEARRLVEDCLVVRDELGDVRGVTLCLSELGKTAQALGDLPDAAVSFTRAFELAREIGNPWGMTAALLDLASVATIPTVTSPATAATTETSAARDPLAVETATSHDPIAARLLHEALRLALSSRIAPQVAAVCVAGAPVLRRAGEPAFADALLRSATPEPADLASLAEPAARLLAWTETHAPPGLTLEQAIAQVTATLADSSDPEPTAR